MGNSSAAVWRVSLLKNQDADKQYPASRQMLPAPRNCWAPNSARTGDTDMTFRWERPLLRAWIMPHKCYLLGSLSSQGRVPQAIAVPGLEPALPVPLKPRAQIQSLCRNRSSERGSSKRNFPLGSTVCPVLPETGWWLGWINGCSTWWTSGMKSCFRSCEMLPTQEASEVLILNKSKHSKALCEHPSLCLWVPYLNQTQNGQVRNKMQLKGSRSTETGFQLKRNGWASSHTNHLPGTSGQNLPEPCQKGWGSLALNRTIFIPFPETKDGISSPGYKLLI